jgi:hypothetical protein
MGDELLPLSDEQAKLADHTLGYLQEILGDLPKDLVGIIAGDPVKALRKLILEKVWERTKKINQDRGAEPQTPSPKLALPILAAAANETSEDLQDLWARLLAAAMDPTRQARVRQGFIATIGQMDPIDAMVLQTIRAINSDFDGAPRGEMQRRLSLSPDDLSMSLDHLVELKCLYSPNNSSYQMTPYGRGLLYAVDN